jgi:Na+/H+-translocating membrane pyrophosphatase
VAGYALGASVVALFARVGGGIFAKAADLGTDIAGKIGEQFEQISTNHPGTNADNVGDNIGDVAGIGSDLFGSLVEAMVAALVLSTTSWSLMTHNDSVYFPIVIPSVGIVTSFFSLQFVHIPIEKIETRLRVQLIISTII